MMILLTITSHKFIIGFIVALALAFIGTREGK